MTRARTLRSRPATCGSQWERIGELTDQPQGQITDKDTDLPIPDISLKFDIKVQCSDTGRPTQDPTLMPTRDPTESPSLAPTQQCTSIRAALLGGWGGGQRVAADS